MISDYDDAEDTEAYEDELYHEESSSEQSVDSEVEFHLYSQIHYSQNLGEVSTLEMDEKADVAEVTGHSSGLSEKQGEDEKEGEEFNGGGAQLSDDPEVIVLSDTPDEVSIYKSKAKRFRSFSAHDKKHIHPVSSTPSHTKAAGCNALCPPGSDVDTPRQSRNTSGMPSPVSSAGSGAIHEVLVEDSSEEESVISDSDNVESWMLLGAGADDRDGDIILNLEGCAAPVREGEVDVDWSISHKDLEAQISNYARTRHSSVRYYTADKNVTCRNCDRPGHLSKNCPTPKKVPPCCLCAGRDHLQHSCPARFCLNCCLPGHYFRECLERAYWNKHCNRCDMKGHYADTKPGPIEAARFPSERSMSAYCYNCSRKGHLGYECSEKRMQGSMFPTSPFVYYYDDECDIKRRASRLKRKVADLQEAGLLPEQPETPRQEEQLEGHSHRKKSKPWKEEHRKHSRDGKQYKKMKVSRAGKPQEEKHRRSVEFQCDPGREFPRGHKQHVCKGSKVQHKSLFHTFPARKALCVQEPLEGAKRKKKWKKQKDASPVSKDNLFLIKQRRKKSKQKSW
ncbi:zinc finger CCHC domain-containing protein 7 isoform X2 [Pithys albifrons albifrons]|uniref:zinc finger CCHC domain-containing protein 7 isoform X2 n=1 Tax=Pithys albifrons albifrons TaxID=3385563 RepID=UPI003A5CCB51